MTFYECFPGRVCHAVDADGNEIAIVVERCVKVTEEDRAEFVLVGLARY